MQLKMTLEGRIYKSNTLLYRGTAEQNHPELSFTKQLEACLLELCKRFDVPIPFWLTKNTTEFARFHQTIFFNEQFPEPVLFDRFQIRWVDDGR